MHIRKYAFEDLPLLVLVRVPIATVAVQRWYFSSFFSICPSCIFFLFTISFFVFALHIPSLNFKTMCMICELQRRFWFVESKYSYFLFYSVLDVCFLHFSSIFFFFRLEFLFNVNSILEFSLQVQFIPYRVRKFDFPEPSIEIATVSSSSSLSLFYTFRFLEHCLHHFYR